MSYKSKRYKANDFYRYLQMSEGPDSDDDHNKLRLLCVHSEHDYNKSLHTI